MLTYSTVAPEVLLPDLTKFISKTGDYPVAGGGFGDIWKCIYETDGGQIDVSLRYLSTPSRVDHPAGCSEIITCIRFIHR